MSNTHNSLHTPSISTIRSHRHPAAPMTRSLTSDTTTRQEHTSSHRHISELAHHTTITLDKRHSVHNHDLPFLTNSTTTEHRTRIHSVRKRRSHNRNTRLSTSEIVIAVTTHLTTDATRSQHEYFHSRISCIQSRHTTQHHPAAHTYRLLSNTPRNRPEQTHIIQCHATPCNTDRISASTRREHTQCTTRHIRNTPNTETTHIRHQHTTPVHRTHRPLLR